MTRTILLVAPGEAGHALPMLSVARALTRRGHRALFYGDEKFAEAAKASGAELLPSVGYRALMTRMEEPAPVPRWVPRRAQPIWKFRAVLLACALDLARDLQPILRSTPVDCVIGDFLTGMGAGYAAELERVPYASVAPTPLTVLSASGLPMLLTNPRIKRIPPRLLTALVDRLFPLSKVRAELGLPPRRSLVAEFLRLAASESLHLVLAHRGFLPDEPAREGQEFVGPMAFDTPSAVDVHSLLGRLAPGTVLVTTTTTQRDSGLFSRTLSALAPLGIPLLATAAGTTEIPAGLGEHVRIEPFVPHGDVFPHIAALVTHGGWGTVGRALQHGVPMLIISVFGDQPMTGARAEELGLAYHLRLSEATPEAIRDKVKELLADEPLKKRVKAVAAELSALDTERRVADLIEGLIAREGAARR